MNVVSVVAEIGMADAADSDSSWVPMLVSLLVVGSILGMHIFAAWRSRRRRAARRLRAGGRGAAAYGVGAGSDGGWGAGFLDGGGCGGGGGGGC
ncbi:hypothetical protein [Mycolicibacterium mucogenicum]|uniref:hypothetical protein n=1 Tax=Mycolicibacterium mucogenicum TaxID=56689 RepID=UPI0006B39912|nr:hypothetical protein [Mycolicibacterium mucogenicum]